MKWLISLGIIAVATIGVAYFIKRNSAKKVRKLEVPTQKIPTLDMPDVVGFFRSLQLDQTKDKAFLCTSPSKITEFVSVPELSEDETPVLLGVYDEKDDKIDPLKLLIVKNLSQDVKRVMGNDPLVVLS